jgi:hypothetical protein
LAARGKVNGLKGKVNGPGAIFFAASACKALISHISRPGIAIFCNILQLSEALKAGENAAFGKLLQQIASGAPACVRERRRLIPSPFAHDEAVELAPRVVGSLGSYKVSEYGA